MKHTHKIIAAAFAVIFAIMPINVQAQVRHTENTYYMQYAEGQELGTLTYAGITLPVLYGIEQTTVDTGNVELFGLSAPDHLIMLSHSDKGFSRLYENSQIGAKINVVLNNNSVWYEIINAYWIDQATWESEQFMRNFYYSDETPLTLVTCNHRGGVRGRWVVQCTYSAEPIQNNIVEDVVINENIEMFVQEENELTETIVENEIAEKIEIIEETPDITMMLNIFRMKMPYVRLLLEPQKTQRLNLCVFCLRFFVCYNLFITVNNFLCPSWQRRI